MTFNPRPGHRRGQVFINGMSNDQIRSIAPAVFAEKPAAHTSPDYRFVPTIQVIEGARREGWEVISVCQQKVRKAEDKEFTKHKVIMRNMHHDVQALELGGLIPTLMLVGSHNWACSFEILSAMLRLVCENGLVAMGAQFEAFKAKHDSLMEDVFGAMSRFQSNAEKMLELAFAWERIMLSQRQIEEFNAQALRIRFGDDPIAANPANLLPVRLPDYIPGETANTLWRTFNVAQEYMVNGGFKNGRRRARAIGNIAEQNRLNKELFQLADGIAAVLKA